MNYEESQRALAELRASPAAGWIGNKFTGTAWIQKCTRCGATQALELPSSVYSLMEKILAWKRDFQVAHEDCLAGAA